MLLQVMVDMRDELIMPFYHLSGYGWQPIVDDGNLVHNQRQSLVCLLDILCNGRQVIRSAEYTGGFANAVLNRR